jgi:hypothetical protein
VFASRDPTARQSELLRTRTSIPGAKAKNLTLRHPMNNSHVSDPSQEPSALYYTNTNASPLDRQNVREPAQPMKGAVE